MPADADSGRVRLLTGVTLPLQERKGPVMKKQVSIIKAAQESDEKKMIFQVGNGNSFMILWLKGIFIVSKLMCRCLFETSLQKIYSH